MSWYRVWLVALWMQPLGLLAVALQGCAGGAVTATVQPAAPLDRSHVIRLVVRQDMVLTPVSINGQPAGFFLVDTGSSVTVIDRATADRLDLKLGGVGFLSGIAGTQSVRYGRVAEMMIDHFAVGEHEVAVTDLSLLQQSMGWEIGGIIGVNVLRAAPYTLDYQSQTLTVHPPGRFVPPAGVEAQRLQSIAGLPAIRAVVASGGDVTPIWMQIDSGSNSALTLPLALSRTLPSLIAGEHVEQVVSTGIGGTSTNLRARLDHLVLPGKEVRDVGVQLETNSPFPRFADMAVGRMGNVLLRDARITFDHTSDRIWLQWQR